MEEIRIDVTKQTPEELALANEQAQLIFRFNHTMPGTAEYDELMHRIFRSMGNGSIVSTPLTAVRPHMVTIGKNVVVMPDDVCRRHNNRRRRYDSCQCPADFQQSRPL